MISRIATSLTVLFMLIPITKPAFAAAPLELQVAALETLHGFDCSNDQLHAIDTLAATVQPGAAPAMKGKPSAAYQAALVAARDALLTTDDDKISDAEESLDTVRDQENIVPPPPLEVTDTARSAALDVLKLLKPSQIASYLADHADDVPDPLATLSDAIDQIDGKPEVDFQAIKKEAAEQVAVLLGGIDPTAQMPIIAKVNALLDEAHKLTPADLKSKRPALDAEAAAIVKTPDPVECLRHWLQRELADLMTNPALRKVLADRLKNT